MEKETLNSFIHGVMVLSLGKHNSFHPEILPFKIIATFTTLYLILTQEFSLKCVSSNFLIESNTVFIIKMILCKKQSSGMLQIKI